MSWVLLPCGMCGGQRQPNGIGSWLCPHCDRVCPRAVIGLCPVCSTINLEGITS